MKITAPKLKAPKIKKPNFSWIKNLHPRKFNTNTFLAMLSYLYFLAFIPLIFSRRSDFVKFHAKQGIILMIVWTVGIFSFYLPVLPYLFVLFIAVEIVYGIINVFLGRERQIFWVGKLANKI